MSRHAYAARTLGALVLAAASAPLFAATYALPEDGNVVGELMSVRARAESNLAQIARHSGLGYGEIAVANAGTDVWLPGEGREVLLPTRFLLPDAPRTGIVVNLPEMRLYYYRGEAGAREVDTYPIGIGTQGWSTPEMSTTVVEKRTNPTWFVPASVRAKYLAQGEVLPAVVPPGPDNPLGDFAMRLGARSYLIHGTNQPAGIGLRVSSGCIRMYPEDIERLFDQVGIGTPVRIVHQPVKAALVDDRLLLEVHRPLEDHAGASTDLATLTPRVIAAASVGRSVWVDWNAVERAVAQADGVPSAVGLVTNLDPARSWFLVAGSYDAAENAAAMVSRLTEKRLDARVWRVSNRHQVEVGPFADRHQADFARRLIHVEMGILALKVPPRIDGD